MINPAIVVIAYNRDKSLERLLGSLLKASYDSEDVTLVISIDKSDNEKVASVADAFEWKHGEKKIILRETNLGLKKHVLECGKLVYDYEKIIVLEDDLYVSESFYSYARQALDFSENCHRIAGVSLYNHCMNVHVREPFEAIDDGYDNYYMQFAQSWGQAYTRKQWQEFEEWLEENDDKSVAADNVPVNVSSWSDKSWLKYFIKYVIDTDKLFIYPRVSFTTNFGDEGTHAEGSVTDLQVPLAGKNKKAFTFSMPDESDSIYDAYFENMKLADQIEETAAKDELSVDLYGYGKAKKKYILSSKPLPYKVIKSYGRKLRPVDANIYMGIDGTDFFLYNTEISDKAPDVNVPLRILYNYKALNVKKILKVLKYRLLKK